MQTKNTATELANLLSRLTPSRVSTYEDDDGKLVLYLSLRVVGDIDGQKWRRLAARCPLWHERIGAIRVEFLDSAAHSARTWGALGSLVKNGEGLAPEGTAPARRIILLFALTDTSVVAEELPLISTVTFSIIKSDGVVVHEPTTRRVAVANVPSMEREGC